MMEIPLPGHFARGEDSPCPTLTSAKEGAHNLAVPGRTSLPKMGSENGGYLNTADGGEND